jgi:hypothetical protein
MHLCRIVLILNILLNLPFQVHAALFTDDTWTMDKGHFELEYGINYYKDTQYISEEDYKARTRQTNIYLYLLYGLAENWDVGITVPYGYINYDRETKSNGFLDIDIESKYRFLEETELSPSVAIYLDFITGSANEKRSLGTGEQDLFLNGIFSKTLKENLWLDLNLGYYFTGGKGADDVFIYALGLTHGFREKLYIYAELYGEAEFERNFNDNVCLGALSVGYEVNPRIFVKTGLAVGISDGADDLQISGRINFSF